MIDKELVVCYKCKGRGTIIRGGDYFASTCPACDGDGEATLKVFLVGLLERIDDLEELIKEKK